MHLRGVCRSSANVWLAEVFNKILTIKKMKLTKENLTELMSKHIYQLSVEELEAIAFILDFKITEFKKNVNNISFNIIHKRTLVIIECYSNSNCSIGRTRKSKNNISGLVSYGGVFSIGNALAVIRGFYLCSYELTLNSINKRKIYPADCGDLVMYADALVTV